MKKLFFLIAIVFAFNATAEDFNEIVKQDKILGKITAPVTFIEYASMTCGHCARFHKAIFSKLKEEYIDTGKVVFANRHMPLDDLAFAVSKVIECAPEQSYYNFVDAFFASQKQWISANDKLQSIKNIARLGGLSGEQVEQCIQDEKIHEKINYFKNSAVSLGINSTPSFIINGKLYRGVRSYESVKALIEEELGNE